MISLSKYEGDLFAGIRNRINDAIKRIRDLRVP